MPSVKIFGAGSIGNHLANAAHSKGWDVTVCDVDPAALRRMKEEIYPARYGKWNDAIELCDKDVAAAGGFDYVFVGTPPDSHIPLALEALKESPKAILVEKPFATPDLNGCQDLFTEAAARGIKVFVGYDHVVAPSTKSVGEVLRKDIGDVQALTVAFREHWQGIFNAHPWLKGPADTYLGFWRRGGGALGEHSHAVNLWQHLAHEAGVGRVVEVRAMLDYVEAEDASYDRIALLHLRTEKGLVGDVIQDVVTRPPLKAARVQGSQGAVEWQCQPSPYADFVRKISAENTDVQKFSKTRPQDFIAELDHIELALEKGLKSPISIERGLDTMLVIAAGHMSAAEGRSVKIDYAKGYTAEALSIAG